MTDYPPEPEPEEPEGPMSAADYDPTPDTPRVPAHVAGSSAAFSLAGPHKFEGGLGAIAAAFEDPAAVDTMAELNDRRDDLLAKYPELIGSPGALLTLASTDLDPKALDAAVAEATGQKKMMDARERLLEMDDDEQRAHWDAMSEDDQERLRRMGYKPPEKPGGFRINLPDIPGSFDIIPGKGKFDVLGDGPEIGASGEHGFVDFAAQALAFPGDALSIPLKEVGGRILSGLDWLADQPMRAFRGGQYQADRQAVEADAKRDFIGRELNRRGYVIDNEKRIAEQDKYNTPNPMPWSNQPSEGLLGDVYGSTDEEFLGPGQWDRNDPDSWVEIRSLDMARALGVPAEVIEEVQAAWDDQKDEIRAELRAIHGPTPDFGKAFTKAGDGEALYTIRAQRDAYEADLDGDRDAYNLVKKLVGVEKADWAAAIEAVGNAPVGSTRYQELLDLTGTPGFEAAHRRLSQSEAKYSVGRTAAERAGFTPGTPGYDRFSGAIDATSVLTLDPTLRAGAVLKASRVGRTALRGENAVLRQQLLGKLHLGKELTRTEIDNLALVGIDPASTFALRQRRVAMRAGNQYKAAERIAQRMSENNPYDLVREMPHLEAGIDDMRDWFTQAQRPIRTADDIYDYWASQAGRASLTEGRWTATHLGRHGLPQVTFADQAKWISKRYFQNVIDFWAESGWDMIARGTERGGAAGGAWRTAGKTMSGIPRFVQAATTHVPRDRAIGTLGAEALGEANRLIESFGVMTGVKRAARRQAYNDFVMGLDTSQAVRLADGTIAELPVASVAQRRTVLRAFMIDTFEAARSHGALIDDAADDSIQRFLNQFELQRYGPRDVFRLDSEELRSAILPKSHHATKMVLPSIRDIIAQTNRLSFTRRALGLVNRSWVDAGMGYIWKPSMLMRIGFIPRAAGEEALSLMLRIGTRNYWANQMARFAERGGPDTLVQRGPQRIWQSAEYKRTLAPLRAGHWMFSSIDRSFDALARRMPNPLTVRARSAWGDLDTWARFISLHQSDALRRGVAKTINPKRLEIARKILHHNPVVAAAIAKVDGVGEGGWNSIEAQSAHNDLSDHYLEVTPDGHGSTEVGTIRNKGSQYETTPNTSMRFRPGVAGRIAQVGADPVAPALWEQLSNLVHREGVRRAGPTLRAHGYAPAVEVARDVEVPLPDYSRFDGDGAPWDPADGPVDLAERMDPVEDYPLDDTYFGQPREPLSPEEFQAQLDAERALEEGQARRAEDPTAGPPVEGDPWALREEMEGVEERVLDEEIPPQEPTDEDLIATGQAGATDDAEIAELEAQFSEQETPPAPDAPIDEPQALEGDVVDEGVEAEIDQYSRFDVDPEELGDVEPTPIRLRGEERRESISWWINLDREGGLPIPNPRRQAPVDPDSPSAPPEPELMTPDPGPRYSARKLIETSGYETGELIRPPARLRPAKKYQARMAYVAEQLDADALQRIGEDLRKRSRALENVEVRVRYEHAMDKVADRIDELQGRRVVDDTPDLPDDMDVPLALRAEPDEQLDREMERLIEDDLMRRVDEAREGIEMDRVERPPGERAGMEAESLEEDFARPSTEEPEAPAPAEPGPPVEAPPRTETRQITEYIEPDDDEALRAIEADADQIPANVRADMYAYYRHGGRRYVLEDVDVASPTAAQRAHFQVGEMLSQGGTSKEITKRLKAAKADAIEDGNVPLMNAINSAMAARGKGIVKRYNTYRKARFEARDPNAAQAVRERALAEARAEGDEAFITMLEAEQSVVGELGGKIRERLDGYAAGDERVRRVMETLDDLDPRVALAIIADEPIKIYEDLATEVLPSLRKRVRQRLLEPEVFRWARDSQRLTRVGSTGKPVMMPVAEGVQPLYLPVMNQRTSERFMAELADDGTELTLERLRPHLSEDTIELARAYLNRTNDGLWHRQIRGMNTANSYVPAGTFATADPDIATEIAEAIGKVFGTGTTPTTIARRDVSDYGRGAIPEAEDWQPGQLTKAGADHANEAQLVRLMNAPEKAFALKNHFLLSPGQLYGATPLIKGEDLIRMNADGTVDRAGSQLYNGATLDEALDDFANVVSLTALDYLAPRGEVLQELVHPLKAGHFSLDDVQRLPLEDLPVEITVPQRSIKLERWWTRVQNFGFNRVIGPALSSLVRQPAFMQAYMDAADEVQALISDVRDPVLDKAAERQIVKDWEHTEDLHDLQGIWSQVSDEAKVQPMGSVADIGDDLRELGYDGLSVSQLKLLQRWGKHDDAMERLTTQVASERAMNEVIPFIDDHRLRSVLAEEARNIVPFWFAEEQFLKRWARTFKHSPEALRKAQLLVQGISHVGGLHRNEQTGEMEWAIPGSDYFVQFLGNAANQVFGGDISFERASPLTGSLSRTFPGLGQPGQLGYGPLATVTYGFAERLFPELREHRDEVLGPGSSQRRGVWEQFVPAWALRGVQAAGVIGGLDIPADQMSSATIQAMAMMRVNSDELLQEADEARTNGDEAKAIELEARARVLFPPENASPAVRQQYIEEVKRYARVIFFSRAAIGFFSPAQPQADFRPEWADEFGDYLSIEGLSYEEALARFLKDHPEGNAYTVFPTMKPSMAVTDQTAAHFEWLARNEEWATSEDNKLAALWLAPQDPGDFDPRAYYEELEQGHRVRRSPEEWMDQMYFKAASDGYFDAKNAYQDALDDLAEDRDAGRLSDEDYTLTKRELTKAYSTAKDQYFKLHPRFEELLTSSDKQDQRLRILDSLRRVREDPDAPVNEPHVADLFVMIDAVDEYESLMDAMAHLGESNEAKNRRRFVKETFIDWGERYVAENRSLAPFWTAVIGPYLRLPSYSDDTLEEDQAA